MKRTDLLAGGTWSRGRDLDRVVVPRMRVILDNDFSGDPDDLFELVHHLLSPSIEIPFIIGSHLAADDKWDPSATQATNAARRVEEVLELMGLGGQFDVVRGSETAMTDPRTPVSSDAVTRIVDEARREGTDLPLFVACGAGLTEVASALLAAPDIADKLTVIWIGGNEYDGTAPTPPTAEFVEYNHNIDRHAVEYIFNESSVDLWHVPRNAYRQHLLSYAEILDKVLPHGPIGELLTKEIERIFAWRKELSPEGAGETYIMGDQPLVTLTSLLSSFHPLPSSSHFTERRAPFITESGHYHQNPDGRTIRVFHFTDTRLTFEDFSSKIALWDRASG